MSEHGINLSADFLKQHQIAKSHLLEELDKRYGRFARPQDKLLYHSPMHTLVVANIAKSILEILSKIDPDLGISEKDIYMLELYSFGHDIIQDATLVFEDADTLKKINTHDLKTLDEVPMHAVRRRHRGARTHKDYDLVHILGSEFSGNEFESAKYLAELLSNYPALEADPIEMLEVIEATYPIMSLEFGESGPPSVDVRQFTLTETSSLLALALSCADINDCGISPPLSYKLTNFLEWGEVNAGAFYKLAGYIASSKNLSTEEKAYISKSLYSWIQMSPEFVKNRMENFVVYFESNALINLSKKREEIVDFFTNNVYGVYNQFDDNKEFLSELFNSVRNFWEISNEKGGDLEGFFANKIAKNPDIFDKFINTLFQNCLFFGQLYDTYVDSIVEKPLMTMLSEKCTNKGIEHIKHSKKPNAYTWIQINGPVSDNKLSKKILHKKCKEEEIKVPNYVDFALGFEYFPSHSKKISEMFEDYYAPIKKPVDIFSELSKVKESKIIILNNVVQHFERTELLLKDLSKHMKKDDIAIMIVPAGYRLNCFVESCNIFHLGSRGKLSTTHSVFYDINAWEQQITWSGLTLKSKSGLNYLLGLLVYIFWINMEMVPETDFDHDNVVVALRDAVENNFDTQDFLSIDSIIDTLIAKNNSYFYEKLQDILGKNQHPIKFLESVLEDLATASLKTPLLQSKIIALENKIMEFDFGEYTFYDPKTKYYATSIAEHVLRDPLSVSNSYIFEITK